MPTIATKSTFKRLRLNAPFVSAQTGDSYRKVGASRAIRLLASGRGQTHAKLTFTRSHALMARPEYVTI